MLNSLVPVTLKIGVKQKPRKVNRLASLQDVIAIVEKSAAGIPKPWHLSFNNTPLRTWAEAVQFFDISGSARLEITVRDGPLPQPAQPPGFHPGKRLREEEEPEMHSFKRARVVEDAVLTRITLGRKTKPRRFPKQLTTSELLALLVDIFPEITGKKYHLEYLDGYWVNDGEDWAVMQEVVQPEDYVNGRIDLKLAFDSSMPPVVQPKKIVPNNSAPTIQQLSGSVPSVSSSTITPPIGDRSLPKAILQGNYRGGLSEYLMKDPTTRNHQISFNTTTISGVKKSSFQTVCMLVLGGSTYQASAMGQSKKTSVHNAAKQMLVTLGVIPPNYIMGQNISIQQTPNPRHPAVGNNFSSGTDFNAGTVNNSFNQTQGGSFQQGGFNRGGTGFNQGGRGAFSQGGGGFNNRGGFNTAGFNQGIGGGNPWTQFLSMQQNAGSGNWTKAQKNEYHNARINAIWEQIQIIMRRTGQPMNVLWIRKEFPGAKENRPRRKEFNFLLYKKMEEGLLRRNETGDKPSWELLC